MPITIKLCSSLPYLLASGMLTETARVIGRRGKHVELELQRGSACDHCDLNQGCGTGALGRLLRRRSRPLVIETDLDCRPGDEVQVLLPETSLVRASLLIYGLPLLAMVVSGLLATAAFDSDWVIALLAIGGFLGGIRIAALCAARLEHRGMAPHIRERRMNSTRPARS